MVSRGNCDLVVKTRENNNNHNWIWYYRTTGYRCTFNKMPVTHFCYSRDIVIICTEWILFAPSSTNNNNNILQYMIICINTRVRRYIYTLCIRDSYIVRSIGQHLSTVIVWRHIHHVSTVVFAVVIITLFIFPPSKNIT